MAVAAAAILAIGALLIVLDFNRQNGFVEFITDTADNLNFLGTLKEFQEGGKKGGVDVTKTVLVNWGICAVVWIVLGQGHRAARPPLTRSGSRRWSARTGGGPVTDPTPASGCESM